MYSPIKPKNSQLIQKSKGAGMKDIYSIGRDNSCDIVIIDDSNVISRFHAYLRVDKGQYAIIDQSTNGTFVNGTRINSGVDVPVTRNDVVSFANLAVLDWNLIPKSKRVRNIILCSILGGLLLLSALTVGGYHVYFKQQSADNQVSIICDSLGVNADTLEYQLQSRPDMSNPSKPEVNKEKKKHIGYRKNIKIISQKGK